MSLAAGKRAATIVIDDDLDNLLDLPAKALRLSRSELIRQKLRRSLEAFRPHPLPTSAGVIRGRRLRERGDEDELFRDHPEAMRLKARGRARRRR